MAPAPSPTYQRLREFIAVARQEQPGPGGRYRPADPGKRMVGRVLTGNGITEVQQGRYRLIGGEELSDTERDELLQLCRQRLDAFRSQRGEEVFAHRSRHRSPISSSVKYRVLTRGKPAAFMALACGKHRFAADTLHRLLANRPL
jgi:hypothetical protein